jgi:hypothetical protein
MNKEFIPYEQALELKELDFDYQCMNYYSHYGNGQVHLNDLVLCSKIGVETNNHKGILAPTFSQAFRFFREKYKLYHNINPLTFQISEEEPIYEIRGYTCEVKWINHSYTIGRYDTYEESELTCLKKLIEIVKNK